MGLLSVDYLSQMSDVDDPSWRARSCSIVNVKMVLDFLMPRKVPSIKDLIREGIAIDAYTESVGWSHEGIVRLARNHGVSAYAQEFRSVAVAPDGETAKPTDVLVDRGMQKLSLAVRTKPVIVSVLPGFGSNKDNHTVLLIGEDSDKNELYYHDPHAKDSAHGRSRSMSKDEFKRFWRRLAIFFD